jgi:hypothetical protein
MVHDRGLKITMATRMAEFNNGMFATAMRRSIAADAARGFAFIGGIGGGSCLHRTL